MEKTRIFPACVCCISTCRCCPMQSFYSQEIPASSFSMPIREVAIHVSWLVTHFARTLLAEQQAQSWLAGLTTEIEVLQAELHRTQRIMSGYGALLERCERGHRFQAFGNLCFTIILVALTALLFASWCRCRRVERPPQLTSGDSTSSDEPGPLVQTGATPQPGPRRPSTFSKGKR